MLIAGGRNKGLDLSDLSRASSVVGVVGIGEAGAEVIEVLKDRPGVVASAMGEAVSAALDMAEAGEARLRGKWSAVDVTRRAALGVVGEALT